MDLARGYLAAVGKRRPLVPIPLPGSDAIRDYTGRRPPEGSAMMVLRAGLWFLTVVITAVGVVATFLPRTFTTASRGRPALPCCRALCPVPAALRRARRSGRGGPAVGGRRAGRLGRCLRVGPPHEMVSGIAQLRVEGGHDRTAPAGEPFDVAVGGDPGTDPRPARHGRRHLLDGHVRLAGHIAESGARRHPRRPTDAAMNRRETYRRSDVSPAGGRRSVRR